MNILYFHGRLSSPQTSKAEHIRVHTGHDVFVPSYPSQHGLPVDTFPKSYPIATEAVLHYQPDIIVGSSYGGGILLKLITEGLWKGPSLFLAGAGVHYGIATQRPPDLPALLIHGTQDSVISVEDSRLLAHSSEHAHLIEIQDDHSLGTIKNGLLVLCIRHLEHNVVR